MKKVFLAGTALMLAGGIYSSASAADVTPGVVIDGDARVRVYYKSVEYSNAFGNSIGDFGSQSNMDSRVRVNITGTTAGGTYAKARLRIMEGYEGNIDSDLYAINNQSQNNLWADMAYVGIPFSKEVTLEVGKYRSTYGPLPTTFNFFYDDITLSGARGIVKIGDIVINPFVEWMNEAQGGLFTYKGTYNANGTMNSANQPYDITKDNDEYRIGVHAKAKINKDWTVGGMLGYQADNREDNVSYTATADLSQNVYQTNAAGKYVDAGGAVLVDQTKYATQGVKTGTVIIPNGTTKTVTEVIQPNTGLFGSLYVNGKVDQIGVVGEVAYTAAKLNGFNTWAEDSNTLITSAGNQTAIIDSIGSKNDGYGGWIFPNYQIDKLNLGLNLGFTTGGFRPDLAFGFVMIGGKDNSIIGDSVRIGDTGDWLWAGFVPSYQISDSLKLTGNLVYADINKWNVAPNSLGTGGGPYSATKPLDSAWEVSAVLQYTVAKGTDLYFSAGYLKPSFDSTYYDGTAQNLKNDGVLGAATRLEVKF